MKNFPKIVREALYLVYNTYGIVIGVTLEISSASSSPDPMTLHKTFEEAILCLILGPPELEGKALKKVKDIIDFALKYKFLGDSDR